MITGRPTLPQKLKELRGTNQPSRINKNELEVESVSMPTPPEWLSEFARDEWYIVTSELDALQILSSMDLSMLAIYCQQIGIYRECQGEIQKGSLVVDTPNGFYQPSPYLGIANKAADIALKIAGQFGFTPAARSRIGAPKPSEKDPFDAYMEAGQRD
jgi:P27 family predicted phage terminase small subunit